MLGAGLFQEIKDSIPGWLNAMWDPGSGSGKEKEMLAGRLMKFKRHLEFNESTKAGFLVLTNVPRSCKMLILGETG